MRIGTIIKKLGNYSVFLLILTVVLCILAYGTLLLPPVQNYVCNLAEMQLDHFLDGRVEIGKIRSNLLSRMDMYDLKIRDKSGRNDSISVGHIRVRYNLLALLNRTVHILSVYSKDIDASLSVTPDNTYNIPALPAYIVRKQNREAKKDSNSRASSDWNVVLGAVRLRNFNATYKDSCYHFTGSVSRANIRARFPKIDSIKVDLRAPQAYYGSFWWTGQIDTIGASAILRFDGMEVLEAYVRGSGTEVHGEGLIPFSKKGFWDLRAHVSTDVAPVTAIHGYARGIAPYGHLEVDASWAGTLQEAILDYKTSGSGMRYGTYDIDSFSLEGGYDLNSWTSSKGVINTPLGKMEIDAKLQIPALMVNPSFGKYQANIRVHQGKLALLKEKLNIENKNIPGEYAVIDGAVRGFGFKRLPDYISTKIKAADTSFQPDTLKIAAELRNKQWLLNAQAGGALLSGKGRIQDNGVVHGTVQGDIKNVAPFSGYFFKQPVRGQLNFETTIDGFINEPYIHCTLNSGFLKWRSVRVDTLDAVVLFTGKEFLIEKAHSAFTANIDTVSRYFNVKNVGGSIEAVVDASGPISSIDLSAAIRGKQLYYKSYRADTLNSKISLLDLSKVIWSNGVIRTDETEINTDGEFDFSSKHITVNCKLLTLKDNKRKNAGSIAADGFLLADSISAGFNTSKLDVSSIVPWVNCNWEYSGLMSAEGSVTGSYKNLEGKVRARFDKPGYKLHHLAAIDGQLVLLDSLLSATSTILLKDSLSMLYMKASLPLIPSKGWSIDLSGERQAQVALTGKNINLDGVVSLLDSTLVAGGKGNLAIEIFNSQGEWGLKGDILVNNGSYYIGKQNIAINQINLKALLSGTVTVPKIEYKISTGSVSAKGGKVDSLSVSGVSTTDTVKINRGYLWLPGDGMVDLRASLPLSHFDSLLIRPGFQVNFKINKFPLVILSTLIGSDIIENGRVTGAGRVEITKGRPVLSGSLNLENGQIRLGEVEQSLGSVNAKVVMKEDSVLLQELKGKIGKGTIKGDGFLLWSSSGLDQMRVNVKSRDIVFEFRDLATVRVQNGDISISNKREGGYLISGGVDLGPTRVIRDLRIIDLVEQLQRADMAVEKDPLLQSLSLQVEVNLQDNLAVDMNLGDLKMGGIVSVSGTAAQPTYTGQIRISNGFIYYFDRKFEITKGAFYNYDPYDLDPLIDLEAVTEVDAISSSGGSLETVESYTIYLSVQGRLSTPEVRLWSEGVPLDEGNIISILTLGQPLGAIGGDLGDRLKVFAQQSIVGFGARKLENLLGIERIDLKGNLFKFDSDDSPTLSLTKRFSPRFLLSYETALGDLTKPKVTATFRLTKHFFVEGLTEKDNYGLDLLFKYSR